MFSAAWIRSGTSWLFISSSLGSQTCLKKDNHQFFKKRMQISCGNMMVKVKSALRIQKVMMWPSRCVREVPKIPTTSMETRITHCSSLSEAWRERVEFVL